MIPSDFPLTKTKVLNFIRSNPGYSADIISRMLSIPLNTIHQAIADLKKEGKLDPGPTLKISHKLR